MDEQELKPTNLRVVAGGGVAAGLVAGVLVVLGRRNTPPPVTERIVPEGAAAAIAGSADRAREMGRRLVAAIPDSTEGVEEQARTVVVAAKRRADRISSAVDKQAIEAVSERVDRLGRRANKVAERGAKKGRKVTNKATKRAWRAGDQTVSAAQATAAEAAAVAVARAERILARVGSLAETAVERVPELTNTVVDDLAPTLRDAARRTVSSGADLWETARERAGEVTPSVDLNRTRNRAAHAADAVKKRGLRAMGTSTSAASDAAGFGQRVRAVPGRAVDATVGTTKDTGAMLLWGGAAASLVYYALLTPERRSQVNRVVHTTATHVQELVRVFQGYDDDF